MSVFWTVTLNAWAAQWSASIWRACWQGSAAILLVWGLCRALPQMPPRVRCWLWRLAYVKLILALFWATPVDLPLLRSPRTPQPVAAPLAEPALPALPSLPQGQEHGTSGPTPAVISTPSLSPLSALMLLWLLGGIAVGAESVREWRSARKRGPATPLQSAVDAELAAEFAALCRRFGVRRPIALRVTGTGERPHVSGLIRPAIVLPAALLAEPDRAGLQAILAHEIAHVQRKDLLWNWLPAIAHMLFFFCPFVWLANREWQIAQEIACDAMAVLNTRTGAAAYGEMLVRMVAPSRRASRPGIATLGMIETPHTLKRRLIAMRFIHPISRRKLALAGGVCVALGIFGLVPWQVVAQEARANRILFVSNRIDPQRFSIFTMDPDGSHVVRLTHGPLSETEAVSGPGGKTVLRPLAAHRHALELDPVWSPDGKRIVFSLAVSEKPKPDSRVKMNLYVMNADGSDCKQLTYFTYGMEGASPAWSPDGKYIAFTLQSREPGAPGGIDTTVMVSDFTGFWPVDNGMYPTWTPDSKNVLYTYFADRKGLTTDLYEAKLTGAYFGKKKRLSGVVQAVLSPDGKRLAYLAMGIEPNGDKSSNIVVSNADGSDPKPLTQLHDKETLGLQWASNGRQLYFTRPTPPDIAATGNYQIYAIDADGGSMQALTKGDAPDYLGASPGPLLARTWMNRIATMK